MNERGRTSAGERSVPGARFVLDRRRIDVVGRIPAERPLFRVALDGDVETSVRDDAVLVLRATRPTRVRVESLFAPAYDESARGRRLVLDEDGGFGVYPTRKGGGPTTYELRPDDELWLAAFPSRPPDPMRQAQEIAHDGRARPFPDGAYPSTEVIEDAARRCHVFALHAYFWDAGPRRVDLRAGRYALRRRPWTTARHVPADPELFARVRDDVRRAGMKLVVYLSPKHATAPDLFEEMRRMLDEYGVDGLYLDGLGAADFRAADAIVRRTREVLGPQRILYLNASDEPFGTPRVYAPFIDARCDFVLRGDAGRGGLPLERFLRYAVSGRSISNAVGLWCHYGGRLAERAPTAKEIAAVRATGARLWRRSAWGARALAEFDEAYYLVGN